MVPRVLLILGPLWVQSLTQACCGEELSREAVLCWFRERVLEGLGLEEPPAPGPHGATAPPEERLRRAPRTSRTPWVNHQTRPNQETSQIILFPNSDSSCAASDEQTSSRLFTYYFQPSMSIEDSLVTSAHFWFYAGEGAAPNASAPLFILTSAQRLLRAAEAPREVGADGWATYGLGRDLLASVAEGPFLLQVRCAACRCHAGAPDKTPFLHLRAEPRGGGAPERRHRAATIPWSPSAIGLFQRPSEEGPEHSDCRRAQIEISFQELGWDNWIVQPKALTFYYCHGNCSAAVLGITQCCTPAPGAMRSLRVTTTSDGGYSFKYETLPNIIPEECTCI